MEDNLSCTKSKSYPQANTSSSNIKSKNSEQNSSSTTSKRAKKEEFEDEEDLTNKILSNLTYENFESEQEKFYPHYRKKHEEIYINNESQKNIERTYTKAQQEDKALNKISKITQYKYYYIPKCICIVSIHPNIKLFQEILISIYKIENM